MPRARRRQSALPPVHATLEEIAGATIGSSLGRLRHQGEPEQAPSRSRDAGQTISMRREGVGPATLRRWEEDEAEAQRREERARLTGKKLR